MKRFLILLVLGALAGSLLAGWLGRPLIVWDWSTPVPTPNSCEVPVQTALRTLARAQLIAAGVFGVAFGIVGTFIARAWRKRAANKAAAAQSAAAAKPQT